MPEKKNPYEKNNLFEMAHCMLCMKKDNLMWIAHHRNDLIVGFYFVCKECIDIVRNGDLQWQLIPCDKGLEILKGG
jgi:hypothetical protein